MLDLRAFTRQSVVILNTVVFWDIAAFNEASEVLWRGLRVELDLALQRRLHDVLSILRSQDRARMASNLMCERLEGHGEAGSR